MYNIDWNDSYSIVNQEGELLSENTGLIVGAWGGDTVTFLPTDMLHNSQSVPGLIPSSASSWNGAMNEKITVELNAEGIYVYQCTPHIALGMIGVIQVGNPSNIDDIKESVSSLESMIVMNKERVQQYLELVK